MGCSASVKQQKGEQCEASAGPLQKPGSPSPMKKPLFVCIKKATGLSDADTLPGTGLTDAYVVARIGTKGSSWAEKFDDTAERQWKSSAVDNSSDPVWNMAFSLESSVIEAALRTLSPDDDWELHVRVYDSDVIGADYLGEAITLIPSGPEEKEVVLPVTGGGNPKGNMTVRFAFSGKPDWVAAELANAAGVVNGTESGGRGGGMMFTKMAAAGTVAWEAFMSRLASAFQDESDSSITPHNLGYVADMVKFGLQSPTYSEVFYARSKDGGETVEDFPGPGCTMILRHAKVVEGLEGVCAKLQDGEITRTGPDGFLGLLRLNGAWWSQGVTAVEPPCISLATGMSQHMWLRPILETMMGLSDGDGRQDDVARLAREWIDSKHAAQQPFRVRQDVKEWAIKVLHVVLLGISLSDSELTEFVSQQTKITLMSGFVPSSATAAVAPLLGLPEMLQFREQYLDKYKKALARKLFGMNEAELHYLASASLDAMLFAGGASVALTISCTLATVYGGDGSPLARSEVPASGVKDEQFAKQVTWESIRYFPPVVGFPWSTPRFIGATNSAASHRTCLALAAAMKDPRAWGTDAEEFKLRPLAEYHKLSVAFAEQAVAQEGVTGGSRSCPGKSLALACITEFLKAWFATEAKWCLTAEEEAKIAFTGSPTQKPGGFEFKPVT